MSFSNFQYEFFKPGSFRRNHERSRADDGINISEFRFFSEDKPLSDFFGREMNLRLADWLDIAFAVYMADRVSPRDSRKGHRDSWVRQLVVKIGVRDASFWERPEIKQQLLQILTFLTDDRWSLEFTSLTGQDRFQVFQPHLFPRQLIPPRVALFSGGLDSFSGIAKCLNDDSNHDFLLVSCVTNPRQQAGQRAQIDWLRKTFPGTHISHLAVEYGIKWAESDATDEESTQRTRGFLYSTIGTIAAINAGTKKLEIYENGIGAINLAYDASQIGAMNSKSVNPVALLGIERLAKTIVEENFEIENPFLGSTKGEMCSIFEKSKHGSAIQLTFSCDGFPVRESGKPQCGVCSSCLLRRVSLGASGLGIFDIGDGYGTDLNVAESNPSFDQLNDLRAMEWQYRAISDCLSGGDPWNSLAIRFPSLQSIACELAGAKGRDLAFFKEILMKLYAKYCYEWQFFPARERLRDTLKRAAA